jgi:hypothetical protein
MSPNRRRAVARGVLFLYIFISATFTLAHRDYVPLECKRVLSSANSVNHNLDTSGADLVCPAHNFAQSTTSADVHQQRISSPGNFSFVRLADIPPCLARPQLSASSRAPPKA